jgi:hypothetical protein
MTLRNCPGKPLPLSLPDQIKCDQNFHFVSRLQENRPTIASARELFCIASKKKVPDVPSWPLPDCAWMTAHLKMSVM